jgi:Flp pilus assembly protein TadG
VPTSRSRLSDDSGQALAEFALVLPVLLVLLLAMIDFGKAFNYWINATHITAEGARYAVVNRKPDPGSALTLQQQLQGQATAELHNGGTTAVATPAQVCIEFPNGTSNAGDPVLVRMRFTYHWLPFLGSRIAIAQSSVNTTATMRLETAPTNYAAGCS